MQIREMLSPRDLLQCLGFFSCVMIEWQSIRGFGCPSCTQVPLGAWSLEDRTWTETVWWNSWRSGARARGGIGIDTYLAALLAVVVI